jgi:hypothetical protein
VTDGAENGANGGRSAPAGGPRKEAEPERSGAACAQARRPRHSSRRQSPFPPRGVQNPLAAAATAAHPRPDVTIRDGRPVERRRSTGRQERRARPDRRGCWDICLCTREARRSRNGPPRALRREPAARRRFQAAAPGAPRARGCAASPLAAAVGQPQAPSGWRPVLILSRGTDSTPTAAAAAARSRATTTHSPSRDTRTARAPTDAPSPPLLLPLPRPRPRSFPSRRLDGSPPRLSNLIHNPPELLSPAPVAAAPPQAFPSIPPGLAHPGLPGRSRKGGPAQSGGPPFLESPGDKRKAAERRGGGLLRSWKKPIERNRWSETNGGKQAWQSPQERSGGSGFLLPSSELPKLPVSRGRAVLPRVRRQGERCLRRAKRQ